MVFYDWLLLHDIVYSRFTCVVTYISTSSFLEPVTLHCIDTAIIYSPVDGIWVSTFGCCGQVSPLSLVYIHPGGIARSYGTFFFFFFNYVFNLTTFWALFLASNTHSSSLRLLVAECLSPEQQFLLSLPLAPWWYFRLPTFSFLDTGPELRVCISSCLVDICVLVW